MLCVVQAIIFSCLQGERLDLFLVVEGIQVLIGNISCVITDIQAGYIDVIAPAKPDIINEDGNSEILVCGKM